MKNKTFKLSPKVTIKFSITKMDKEKFEEETCFNKTKWWKRLEFNVKTALYFHKRESVKKDKTGW